MMRFLALLLAGIALPALAQEQDVQRQLIQRQQQSDAFTLQLRQSQERLQVHPGDLRRMQELDARQTAERQRLDNLSEKQLREIKPDLPQELRPYERQKAEDERRPLTVPAGEIDRRPGQKPQPLPAPPKGISEGLEPPR